MKTTKNNHTSESSTTMAAKNHVTISIIGTGDFGRALAKKLATSGFQVLCGSRHPHTRNLADRDPEMGRLPVLLVGIPEAIEKADVVFLALHQEHVQDVVTSYKGLLNDKVVVDVTNSSVSAGSCSHVEQLAKWLPQSHVVKAFSTLSAYELSEQHSQENRKVYIVGEHENSVNCIREIANCMGYVCITYNSFSCARELERNQNKLFNSWGKPLIMTSLITGAWALFATVRYHIELPLPWSQWPLHTFNKILALTALTLLSFCYLPGSLASIVQLLRCTKHKAFPSWLNMWLKVRKQLGLMALWMAAVHCVMSVAHNSPAYFKVFYASSVAVNATQYSSLGIGSKMNWIGEMTFTLGALALALMTLLGVTSLPSVGSRLNWRQWVFIQSYIGSACLFVATAHTIVQGLPYTINKPFSLAIKGVSAISLILPVMTLGLRILLLMPCFSVPLYRLRRGWEGSAISSTCPTCCCGFNCTNATNSEHCIEGKGMKLGSSNAPSESREHTGQSNSKELTDQL